jgi:hypothetical protein
MWYNAGDEMINCSGYCYTTQTMGHEYFDFDIPVDEIEV